MRINRANELLSETQLTLADIAARCGFDYLSHLSLAFKQDVGEPPSQYRKRFHVG